MKTETYGTEEEGDKPSSTDGKRRGEGVEEEGEYEEGERGGDGEEGEDEVETRPE